jgi:hypothetical protein
VRGQVREHRSSSFVSLIVRLLGQLEGSVLVPNERHHVPVMERNARETGCVARLGRAKLVISQTAEQRTFGLP